MTKSPGLPMFHRKSLDQIIQVPEDIISVYVVENHIWADGGSTEARAARKPETRTIDEFLIHPVRPFLNDIFRQMAQPYQPARKDNPIGQGYWIQAEFGSGKSHLLSFIGALALGGEAEWDMVRDKEQKTGMGRRESLYSFYTDGLAKKTKETKGIFVAVKTLVGQGGGAVGVGSSTRNLTDYVLDAVAEQFHLETGRSLPLYPTEILAERFLKTEDFERYRRDLVKFLKDPSFFDDEQQEELDAFLNDLQNNPDPGVQRDCGQRLWDFYERYLKIRPQIPMETEDVLRHMVQRLLDEGYAGLLLILDEVSLFMKGRTDPQRVEDEKALVVLSNRLAKVQNLPVWTVCAAQQAIETKMAGVKNIIARERLDLVPLLNNPASYYDIALARVREVTDPGAIDQYYEDYVRSFSWPKAEGRDKFTKFFPFYPPSIDVVRAVSYHLTTVRSALYFMLQTLKTQRKRQSRELISLWSLFDDVVEYEEDPSGTTKGIANIKTKWPEAWQAYETAKRQLDTIVKGPLKVYRSRCEKIIRTLFLYHVADLAPNGLGHEELMNSVMEWRDHDKGQEADLQDNLDHYEILADHIAVELAQVVKVGHNFRFNPTGGGTDPREHFLKARAETEGSEIQRRHAWEALLALLDWTVNTRLMTLDLAHGIRSIFRQVAPASQTDLTLKWHGREISGRVYMRDLLDIASRSAMLPSINSAETGLDYAVFISSTPVGEQLDKLVASKKDPRMLFWTPDALTPSESALLVDFAAYRSLVAEFGGRDDQQAKEVLDWVQSRLQDQMGPIYRVVPDSFGRGRIAALDHSEMYFTCQGELTSILTPLVEQVLDATYVCKEMAFDAPAPFNDINAINVINGIVKVGEIPRGAKPNKDISAAQNYGFALQIMRRPNDKKLDLSECRYASDMADWIQEKLGASGATMPVDTLYKNFMGVGGPNGFNYGLSRRMVQLYLLCLVREGKVRVSLSSRSLMAEAIDYTNIAATDFKTAVLEAFDQIQLLRPPEGWEVLAPFAAVLLDDQTVTEARKDSDIQTNVQRVLKFRADQRSSFPALRAGLIDVLEELKSHELAADDGFPNEIRQRMAAWEAFVSAEIDSAEPIPHLRHALDKAFGYHVFQQDAVNPAEVDDLAARWAEVGHVGDFVRHRDRVLAAVRYAAYMLPAEPALSPIARAFERARHALTYLDKLVASETRLCSDLLDPMDEAIDSYRTRYLQAFEQVTGQIEQTREAIEGLPGDPAYRALACLGAVPQLGADPCPGLRQGFDSALESLSQLFPASLTRAEVERQLRHWPQPAQCPLTLENAADWPERADDILTRCRDALRAALLDRAALLHSDALRERLAQGRTEPFIAGLLDAPTPGAIADYLAETLGRSPAALETDPIDLLARYLKKLRVRTLRLADFAPGKRTIEASDVEHVVAEFRQFLMNGLAAGEDEMPIVELE